MTTTASGPLPALKPRKGKRKKKRKDKVAGQRGPLTTFKVNGKRVRVRTDGDVRVLWVLRDLLGITGPKYGCGINVCKACTSHLNGKAFNPCAVPIDRIKPDDEITTIEGLPRSRWFGGKKRKPSALHPMQEAWIKYDVSQCGYCQPGQIMAAVDLVRRVKREARAITDADLDAIRNICRCGTYPRLRRAIRYGARRM